MNPDPNAPAQRVTIREQAVVVEGIQRPVRRVLRLIERSIDRRGQPLIAPELTLEVWTTSLPETVSAQAIIALYADHGTHELFHSEFKTDLDLTRLPSGKFGTNYLVCRLVALAMIILRLMGQRGLLGPEVPVRHSAKRRRIKTVMQELFCRAARLIEYGRHIILDLGANDRAATVFMRMRAQFAATPWGCSQAGPERLKDHPELKHPNHRPRHGSPRRYEPGLAAMGRPAMRIARNRRSPGASHPRLLGMRNECGHGNRELGEQYAGQP
jgi:hypothetical protein